MRIGIIGCGFIGHKRADVIGDHTITWTADTDLSRAQELAGKHGSAKSTERWQDVIGADDVDAVFISTTHDNLASIALAAAQAGKNFIVEKPAARSSKELKPVLDVARKNNIVAKVGFNHRFHPAFLKAREIFESGKMGPMMFIRGRYGHGGRVGYEKEWRMVPEISGGGELIDQGMHLIDLSRWFLGDFSSVEGHIATCFWDIPVEDNVFMTLRTDEGQVAWLHATWTEWKNMFSFEIYGKYGKLQIDGLGGSYGMEKLTYHQMLPEMGPPETSTWEYPEPDNSWKLEFDDFAKAVDKKSEPMGSLEDALAALTVVDQIYGEKPE